MSFEDKIIQTLGKEFEAQCPFCEHYIDDTAEYVAIGVGWQQVTPNYCDNEECGASELGHYSMDNATQVYRSGWVRDKRPDEL